MHLFLIYDHQLIHGIIEHAVYTETYAETIESGARNFCMLLRHYGETLPLVDARFCIQQIVRSSEHTYDLVGDIMTVFVHDLWKETMEFHWNCSHA